MRAMTVMPRESRDWTVHDLDLLPDDGLQYELLDGSLLVSPAPTTRHQRAVARLYLLLAAACPDDLELFFAPLDWRPDIRTSLQPDLLVVRKQDVELANITRPLVLAVEILSPSTRRKTRSTSARSTRTPAWPATGSSTRSAVRSAPSTSSTGGM